MQKQKFLSEFFRLQATAIKDKRCCLIIVSQVRENIGVMYGPKFRRAGGKALDFYAAQVVWLREAEKKDRKGKVYGITTYAKTTKNKVGMPFRDGCIDILFDLGVDDVATNLNYLCDMRTDTGKLKKADKYSFAGKQGALEELITHIEEKNLEQELRNAVIAKWEKAEAAVASTGRKRRF
jgi:hypothetical protein